MTDEGYTSSQTSSHAETIIFAPYSFDVILLVDTQETVGATCNPLDDETIRELSKLEVNFEVRHLKVGDFTWICRERNTKQELILPFIVERKRMDDLGGSIRDGRFYEQKFRLKQCGIQNLMYLVESYGKNTHTGLPLTALMQGATNTLIQDQFQVKFTENHRHSMQYLSGMTVTLKNIYEKKTVMNCSKDDCVKTSIFDDLVPLMLFTEFNKNASKMRNFKVQEIFVRQLLQLKGVSVEKALAIVEKYPTPTLLKLEYDRG
ncbi:mus81 [Carabus blaptoides fortunei]